MEHGAMEKCGFRYQFSGTEFVRLMGETQQNYFVR